MSPTALLVIVDDDEGDPNDFDAPKQTRMAQTLATRYMEGV